MTFGVPVEHFPVTYEGELKTSNHLKWLARRKLKEKDIQSLGKFEGVDLPCTYDILLGRGKSIQNHSGNILMRNLIWHYIPIYRSATKKGKVVWTVLHATKATGARFLERQTNGWWVEVSDEVARAKVSMSFRTSFTASLPTVNMRQQIYHQKISLKMEERDSKRAKCQDHRVGVHDDQDEPRGVDNCFAMLPWMPFQRHG